METLMTTESSFTYYIFCLVAIVVGLFVMKKITGCIVRAVIAAVVVAALAAVYFLYLR